MSSMSIFLVEQENSTGQSVIEAGTEVHSSVTDDRLHPESDHIHRLQGNLRDEGYFKILFTEH